MADATAPAGLFTPLTLAGHTLRNRIGFAAMSSRLARDGAVTEALIGFLAARAAGGAALVVTEALAAARSAATPARVAAHDEASLPGLARLADAVSRHGALPIGQLWHGGSAHRGARGLDAVGPSAVADGMSWTVPRVLSAGEVEALVEEYAASADRLRRAGFAGVELSAAHGFLPLQFLSPFYNRRTDAWGGDSAGRSRFVRAILRAIRAHCGPTFIVGLKLPADDGIAGSIEPEESARLTAAIVADTPPDWLCFSQGSHGWSLAMHSPDMHAPLAPYRALWRRLRAAAGAVPIAAIGRIPSPALAEDIVASGDAALVMLARPLLADPNWPRKAAEGRMEAIRPCIQCSACWGEINRGVSIACAVNPHVGTAADGAPPPTRAATPRHVVVVGAGPAGLQAALAAAERGHRVTLLGASAETGGAARLHARLPGCGDIARFLDHLADRAARAGVTIRRGVATVESVLVLAADTVVLATGATMPPPDDFADADGAALDIRRAAAALLAAPARRGGLAVLYDHDHTPATYAAAELLAARYRRVVLATPRETIALDCPLIYAQGVHGRLARAGIEIRPCRRPVSLAGGILALRHVLTGAEETIAGIDLFAFATPRRPRDELAAPLAAAGLAVRVVGDALAPRLMLSAVREGEDAGAAA